MLTLIDTCIRPSDHTARKCPKCLRNHISLFALKYMSVKYRYLADIRRQLHCNHQYKDTLNLCRILCLFPYNQHRFDMYSQYSHLYRYQIAFASIIQNMELNSGNQTGDKCSTYFESEERFGYFSILPFKRFKMNHLCWIARYYSRGKCERCPLEIIHMPAKYWSIEFIEINSAYNDDDNWKYLG